MQFALPHFAKLAKKCSNVLEVFLNCMAVHAYVCLSVTISRIALQIFVGLLCAASHLCASVLCCCTAAYQRIMSDHESEG